MILLDKDVLIDVQRGHAALAWFASLSEVPSVPGLVVMESIQVARDAKEAREALRLTAPLPFVWPTTADCQRALADFTAFHVSQGLWPARFTIRMKAIGPRLVLHDRRHISRIPGRGPSRCRAGRNSPARGRSGRA